MQSKWVLLLPLIAIFAAAVFLVTTTARGSQVAWVERFTLSKGVRLGPCRQLVFAVNRDGSSCRVTVRTMEKEGQMWRSSLPPFRATIGEKGFAPPGKKKEGDGKSPSGIFFLTLAFGYDPSVPTRMPYRQVTDDDYWVDDIDSEDYNRWVTGRPEGASAEKLKRHDNLYRYGIVIEYNMNPVVKGKGSAIFIHVSGGSARPTRGCVALPENNMLELLGWLDPEKKPMIIMGTETELGKLR